MVEKKTFDYDLAYLQASLGVFEDYLLSDEVFWPLSGNPPEGMPAFPLLTLGGVLLAQVRLIAYPATIDQQAQSQKVSAEVESVRSKWRVRLEQKATHSFTVRLRMWGDYLEEYRSNPQDNADRYSYEVRLRTMLELLKLEGGGQAAEHELLSGLDRFLQSALLLDGFIWEPEVEGGFPRGIYWFLYGRIPARIIPA
jgi:hypothetical protein